MPAHLDARDADARDAEPSRDASPSLDSKLDTRGGFPSCQEEVMPLLTTEGMFEG